MRLRSRGGWIAAGVVVVVAVGVAVWVWWPDQRSNRDTWGWAAQAELPMPVSGPSGVAVSASGDVYVSENEGIQRLPAGRYTPERIGLPDLHWPSGFAIGQDAQLYVCDYQHGQVLKVAADTKNVAPLPLVGFGAADLKSSERANGAGVAVDRTGNVYITDPDNARILKFPAGSSTQVVLLTVDHLGAPITVSDAGELVVTSTAPVNRLLRIPPGSVTPAETPLPAGEAVAALAFDHDGALLLADNAWIPDTASMVGASTQDGRLWRIPAGSTAPIRLPYAELGAISGIAVDPHGEILITDRNGGRAVRLTRKP